MKKEKLILTLFVAGLSLFIQCSNQKSDIEAQKLIDRQAELIKEGQKEIESYLGEMSSIKDSMVIAQKKLSDDRQLIADELKFIDKEKSISELNKEQNNLDRLKQKRDSIRKELEYSMAIEQRIFDQIQRLEDLEDSLINTSNVISGFIHGSETGYKEEILIVDQQLSKVERQQISIKRSMNMDQKKIDVAKRKVQLLQDEILLLEEEKTNRLRMGDSNEQLSEIANDIKTLENQITTSSEKIQDSQKNIASYKVRLAELEQIEVSLQQKINKYHETKGIVSEFAEAEQRRTQQNVTELREKTDLLSKDKMNVWESKQLVEKNLDEVDRQISELENAKLPNLTRKVAASEITATAQEKIESNYKSELDSIGDALSKSGETFEQETQIISYEQQLLAKQSEQSQNERSSKLKKTTIIVSATIVMFLVLFYIVGSARKRKLTNSKQ